MARAGPSKVAKKPSPAVSFSTPRHRSSADRTIAWCASISSFHRWSWSAAWVSVGFTMSVNTDGVGTESMPMTGRSAPTNCRIAACNAGNVWKSLSRSSNAKISARRIFSATERAFASSSPVVSVMSKVGT